MVTSFRESHADGHHNRTNVLPCQEALSDFGEPEKGRRLRVWGRIRRPPTKEAGSMTPPASGPKAPPVAQAGPTGECLIKAKGSRPLTWNPKIVPSKKFQPMWRPMLSHNRPVRSQPQARKYPAASRPMVEARPDPGVARRSRAKLAGER